MYSHKFKCHILVIITFFFKFNYAKLKGCSDENIEYLELCHKVRKIKRGVSNRDRPRFFDQVGHQTTNASVGNKHFFTK